MITTQYEVGDALSGITGTVSIFEEMVHFIPLSDPGAPVSSGNEVGAIEVGIEEFWLDFELFESRLVKIVAAGFMDLGIISAGEVYKFAHVEAPLGVGYFRATFSDTDYIGTPVPDTAQNITGIANRVNNGRFLTPRNMNDFEPYSSDFQLLPPSMQPGSGTYTGPIVVSFSVDFPFFLVYYTLDGSEPTEESMLYTEPFTIEESTAVKARVYSAGLQPSSTRTENYIIKIPDPEITPESGFFTEDVEVTISSEDNQASIFYTVDGSSPNENSTLYTGAFTVSETTTVRARAYREGLQPSSTVSTTYTFPVVVQTLAEARALEPGTAVQLTGLSTTPDFGFNNAEFYIQDETAGLKVVWVGFGGTNDTETPFAEGQNLTLTGVLGELFQEITIEPVDFDVFSERMPLPEPVLIEDYDTQWTPGSPLQGRRVTIQNVSLLDPSEWPTGPISVGTGLTVQAVDAAGDIYDIRISRNTSDFDGSPTPPEIFNLSGVLGTFANNAQVFAFYSFDLEEGDAAAPRAQIIHNAADPALAEVDIYVNDEKLFSEVPFRGATPFFDAPANTAFTVSLTAAGDDLENAVFEAGVTLGAGNSYYIIARGVLDPSAFDPSWDGEDTTFGLDIIEGAIEASADEDNFDFFIYHGVTDAPPLHMTLLESNIVLVEDFSYTDYTEMPISLPADSHTLLSGPHNASVSLAYTADFSILGGEGGIVLASGFFFSDGPMGMLVVLPNGSASLLDVQTSTESGNDIPREFALNQNYPNPFNPTTQIQYALPEAVNVRVEVYNITGQLVATLVNGQQAAGVHTVTFDANSLSSGVYLYRIQAGSFSENRMMMLVK